jgi:hypothetical protein
VTLAVVCALAPAIAIAGTWWAWRDYRMHPEKYGYRPGERGKRRRWLTRPQRGGTRQPIRHWTAPWIRR